MCAFWKLTTFNFFKLFRIFYFGYIYVLIFFAFISLLIFYIYLGFDFDFFDNIDFLKLFLFTCLIHFSYFNCDLYIGYFVLFL